MLATVLKTTHEGAIMTKIKFPKPDYKHWTKASSWSLNQAAFLLHGIEPLQFRSLRLAEHDVPSEFLPVQRTYLLLRSVPWREIHTQYHFAKNGIHPAAVIYEAHKKGLPLPKLLYKAIAALPEYKQIERDSAAAGDIKTATEQSLPATASNKNNPNNKQETSTRERRNFLKAIGILVRLHFDDDPDYNRGNGKKLNAYQITQTLLDKAQEIGLELEGLKSLDRKITEALELLYEESER
jgi:hypothetical protein